MLQLIESSDKKEDERLRRNLNNLWPHCNYA